jgi:antitoxin FitA
MPGFDMCCALLHAAYMSKIIQLRNVPDDVHRALKIKAAEAGMSLSDFLVREVISVARRPSLEEILKRIKKRGSIKPTENSAAAVRAEREAEL